MSKYLLSFMVSTFVGNQLVFATNFDPKNDSLVDVIYIRAPLFSFEKTRKTVIDGQPVLQNDPLAQHVVRLDIKGSTCTGAIISDTLILTAGHCVDAVNLKPEDIEVQFTFTGINRKAKNFRFYYKSPPPLKNPSPTWVNGQLVFNKKSQDEFYGSVQKLSKFSVISNEFKTEKSFEDLALIQIESLSDGYSAAGFSRGPIFFNNDLFLAGYGTNSTLKENVNHFRMLKTKLKLIGLKLTTDKFMQGFEYYSDEKKNPCFGDSGAPVFMLNPTTNKFEIFAVHLSGFNNCANQKYGLSPLSPFARKNIQKWANEMSEQIEL